MDLILPTMNSKLAWGLRSSNKTIANFLRIPPWLSKWTEGFPTNPTNWVDVIGLESFPYCHRSSSSLKEMENPLPQLGDQAESSELVSEVTQSTCILDKSTVCQSRHFKGHPQFKQQILSLLSLSSEFLFEKLLNVSGLYIFSSWQNLLLVDVN